jgi:autotransporter-associated beta strand protein
LEHPSHRGKPPPLLHRRPTPNPRPRHRSHQPHPQRRQPLRPGAPARLRVHPAHQRRRHHRLESHPNPRRLHLDRHHPAHHPAKLRKRKPHPLDRPHWRLLAPRLPLAQRDHPEQSRSPRPPRPLHHRPRGRRRPFRTPHARQPRFRPPHHPTTPYTLGTTGGPTLTLDNGTLTARTSLLNSGGEHRIDAPVHLVSPEVQLFSARPTDTLTLAGPLTSAYRVTLHKNGRGLVHLAGNNTFTGEIRVAKGLLRLDSDAAAGHASNKIWLVVSDSDERARSGLRFVGRFTFNRDIAAPGVGDFSCIDVPSDSIVTLAGSLTQGGFTKTGAGTLILSGPNHNSNGRSGIAGGRLVLDYTTHNTSKLPNTGIAFGGGVIELRGGSHQEATSEIFITFPVMHLRPGHTEVTRSSGSSTLLTAKRYEDIRRSPGATVDARQPDVLLMSRGTTGAPYGGWATVAGNSFAIASNQHFTAAWIPLTNPSPLATAESTDTNHSQLTSSATLAGNRTTETLRIAPTASGQTLSLATHTLTLNSGGLLVPEGNSHPFSITGGTLRGAPATDLIIHQHGSSDLTLSSTIADHAGPTALTKTGPGTLVLGGANTYTGDTFLNQGTLRLASPAALPAATSLRFHGGTLDLAGHSISVESLTGLGTLQNSGGTSATIMIGSTTAFTLPPGQSILTSDIQINNYQLWAASYGLTTAPNDDPDGDGIQNLLEYALGSTDPTDRAAAFPVLSSSGPQLRITFLRRTGGTETNGTYISGDLTYHPLASADLTDWNIVPTPVLNPPNLPVAPNGFEWISYAIPDTLQTAQKGFIKLEVNAE